MQGPRTVPRLAGALVVVFLGCAEPTTPRTVTVGHDAQLTLTESAAAPTATARASDLLLQQLAFVTAADPRLASTPPTCTILRAYSPSLNFDRTTKIGNCGACLFGNPVLAVATSGAGSAGNTAIATARCGGVDVSGAAAAADPGRGGVALNASAGLQVAGVPECVRSYSGALPASNRSFTCLFF